MDAKGPLATFVSAAARWLGPDRDWLQFDCALSYGLVEYLRTLALLPDYGFTTRNVIPHGGHQLSLNIAALSDLLREVYDRHHHCYGGDDLRQVRGVLKS